MRTRNNSTPFKHYFLIHLCCKLPTTIACYSQFVSESLGLSLRLKRLYGFADNLVFNIESITSLLDINSVRACKFTNYGRHPPLPIDTGLYGSVKNALTGLSPKYHYNKLIFVLRFPGYFFFLIILLLYLKFISSK